MAKMAKGDLEKFRKNYKKSGNGEIMISMGTCGIAAGALDVYKEMEETLKANGINNITLGKTGCLGMCFCEPNLSVKVEGMPEIFYGNVDKTMAHSIITEHVMKKHILKSNVIFMPSKDTGRNIFKAAEAK
ncbi:MAG TPA: (2Fe-2S) ferredoxin domain-containing protein [Candidatus Goldiibacteriota bacterium]|jgi:(2Fe-2S) ferredoxin|nr:(2Fe-2S) ferredoxin domain-containing protein [Candidatus Goldiibacteriota bacterium]HPI04387.1 (2Fe-2S) ferredoxin domain-containing protein [Candidatus Goldiibacteriota bacterium]HPN65102.1 (2Fe-2S) ferredoxin domain-containing protein [Candidatus Goldiibacteriota bacterium]HRQ43155.1 (2Fe-2S) ferredoxin domain-containing protein [Candidatus Goldiibacteriota bacterium]